MAASNLVFDPETETVLREVADNPNSVLLKVPRSKVLPALLTTSWIGNNPPCLSTVERQLLTVHRNELACLLRQVCLMRIVEEPRTRACFDRFAPWRGKQDSGNVRKQINDLAQEPAVPGDHSNVLDLLLRSISSDAMAAPTICELATTSYRLEPTSQARMLAAIDLAAGGSIRYAMQLSAEVLSSHCAQRTRHSALTCMGFGWAKLKNLSKAHYYYMRASDLCNEDTVPLMNRLMFSIQLGDTEDTIRSSKALEERTCSELPAVDWFMQLQAGSLLAGEWQPTTDARRLTSKLGARLGPIGERILDVFR